MNNFPAISLREQVLMRWGCPRCTRSTRWVGFL